METVGMPEGTEFHDAAEPEIEKGDDIGPESWFMGLSALADVFTAQRYATAIYAVVVCLSVCLSVCPSL